MATYIYIFIYIFIYKYIYIHIYININKYRIGGDAREALINLLLPQPRCRPRYLGRRLLACRRQSPITGNLFEILRPNTDTLRTRTRPKAEYEYPAPNYGKPLPPPISPEAPVSVSGSEVPAPRDGKTFGDPAPDYGKPCKAPLPLLICP